MQRTFPSVAFGPRRDTQRAFSNVQKAIFSGSGFTTTTRLCAFVLVPICVVGTSSSFDSCGFGVARRRRFADAEVELCDALPFAVRQRTFVDFWQSKYAEDSV